MGQRTEIDRRPRAFDMLRRVTSCALGQREEGMLKERNGEHPYGGAGQITLLVVFMAVRIAGSMMRKFSVVILPHPCNTFR
jgi:hypothetical protein